MKIQAAKSDTKLFLLSLPHSPYQDALLLSAYRHDSYRCWEYQRSWSSASADECDKGLSTQTAEFLFKNCKTALFPRSRYLTKFKLHIEAFANFLRHTEIEIVTQVPTRSRTQTNTLKVSLKSVYFVTVSHSIVIKKQISATGYPCGRVCNASRRCQCPCRRV